ncbi:hypothetical protein KXS07_10445 [Inquilinus limosus]|uniref:hypothetical protein n=1 Tax=Inquilinus limosus TaxID=171674 RepID=UPI003F16AF42
MRSLVGVMCCLHPGTAPCRGKARQESVRAPERETGPFYADLRLSALSRPILAVEPALHVRLHRKSVDGMKIPKNIHKDLDLMDNPDINRTSILLEKVDERGWYGRSAAIIKR